MIITQINSLIISLTFKVWLKTQYTGKKWWTLLLKEPEMHKMIKESAFVGPPVPSYDRYSIMLGHKLPTALFYDKQKVSRQTVNRGRRWLSFWGSRSSLRCRKVTGLKSAVSSHACNKVFVGTIGKNPQYKQHVVCLERFLSQI